MLGSELTEILQVLKDLLLLVIPHEPQGTLVEEQAAPQQEAGRYQLYGHGNPPAHCARGVHVFGNPVVDPEPKDRPDLVDNLEQSGKDTTNRRD